MRTYWIALAMVPGIGPMRFQRLLDVCGDAERAWHAPDLQMAMAGLERRSIAALKRLRERTTPEAALKRLEQLGITALTQLDADYPASLKHINDPPPVLFVRGELTDADCQAVALVGTRRATPYGRTVAEQLASGLAAYGVTVVSGLAKGVDTAAHRAAIESGGRTIGVLGNGLDQVYPPENTALAKRMLQNGALVSEFPPGTPPDAVNFPRRNRLISGLSRGTVIVEAAHRSGALITADFALEQGREVFAVPGSVLSPMSAGPNELLKQGATVVTSAEDILQALDSELPEQVLLARAVPELSPDETPIWDALSEPRHIDELARTLGRGAGELAATLAILEIRGLARQVGAMTYARIS